MFQLDFDKEKSIFVIYTYDTACSKNNKFIGRYNKILNKKYVRNKNNLAFLIKRKLKKDFFKRSKKSKKKIWVKIDVFRPDYRSDPVNFGELINDAVKIGIGVDDRYYSNIIDWFYDKENPRIEITILEDKND